MWAVIRGPRLLPLAWIPDIFEVLKSKSQTMKRNFAWCVLIAGIAAVLMSYKTIDPRESIEGTWIRKDDNLKIRIDKENALIIEEGNEKFPCDVSSMRIYKDIRQVKHNLWTCNFLVVTMGSCSTNYEAGEIFIDKAGELVIICPGFESKVYLKSKPRYESLPG